MDERPYVKTNEEVLVTSSTTTGCRGWLYRRRRPFPLLVDDYLMVYYQDGTLDPTKEIRIPGLVSEEEKQRQEVRPVG